MLTQLPYGQLHAFEGASGLEVAYCILPIKPVALIVLLIIVSPVPFIVAGVW